MKLEIGNFYVKDVRFGNDTSFADGLLTINKNEAIDFLKKDEHIIDIAINKKI